MRRISVLLIFFAIGSSLVALPVVKRTTTTVSEEVWELCFDSSGGEEPFGSDLLSSTQDDNLPPFPDVEVDEAGDDVLEDDGDQDESDESIVEDASDESDETGISGEIVNDNSPSVKVNAEDGYFSLTFVGNGIDQSVMSVSHEGAFLFVSFADKQSAGATSETPSGHAFLIGVPQGLKVSTMRTEKSSGSVMVTFDCVSEASSGGASGAIVHNAASGNGDVEHAQDEA